MLWKYLCSPVSYQQVIWYAKHLLTHTHKDKHTPHLTLTVYFVIGGSIQTLLVSCHPWGTFPQTGLALSAPCPCLSFYCQHPLFLCLCVYYSVSLVFLLSALFLSSFILLLLFLTHPFPCLTISFWIHIWIQFDYSSSQTIMQYVFIYHV